MREPSPDSSAPRVGSAAPLRHLARLGAVAAVALGALVAHAARVEAGAGPAPATWHARPDSTDSTEVDSLTLDSLRADSLRAARVRDSLAAGALAADTTRDDTTHRAARYLPGLPAAVRGYSVSLAAPELPGLRGRLGTYWRRTVTLDSAAYAYDVREAVGETDVRAPADATLADYLVAQRQAALVNGFRTMTQQRAAAGRRRQGVGFTVDIPGGQQSAFRTLFGRNEVDLTVSGRSEVDLGMSYNANEAQQAISGGRGDLAPDFGQQLNLSVAGTIGDKLRINVNYDTQNPFEFENQVSLVYTGYADDIVQRVEAGNVFLQSPSELIRGGQRLFGLRTDLQFGPLAVTAVASQQDAETTGLTVEGGVQSTPFRLAPYDYEDNTHFFLGYAFHNWWDAAHARPNRLTRPPGLDRIENLEVWKFDRSLGGLPAENSQIVYAVALADLGEPAEVLEGGEEYLARIGDPARTPLPDSTRDRYTDADLAELRAAGASRADVLARLDVDPLAYADTRFRRLEPTEYTYDAQLGWLSLNGALTEDDVLAVSYEYIAADGVTRVSVGDVGQAGQGTSDAGERLILKMLRGVPVPTSPLWDLTMRNVYRVGGRALTPAALRLEVTYEAPSQPSATVLPTVSVGAQQPLLQTLGLDRVDASTNPVPDNTFDFIADQTIDATNGRVIFPMRQPFGDYLRTLILEKRGLDGETIAVTTTQGSLDEAARRYAFPELYDLPRAQAQQRFSGLGLYRLSGQFSGSAQSVFNVGFNVVSGTVRVTSSGRTLVEGADYRVNAVAGTVEVLNPQYLVAGQQLRIEAEQNRIFNVGSKTLLGLRADYRVSENAGFGLTAMRLAERALGDKFRVGEESLQNSIYGFDGRYLATPRWLTRALDALPLLQTRAESRFEIRGEVARFNPGHPQTLAFERTRRTLLADGLDLAPDEVAGLSYVDDFEGSENTYSSLGDFEGWRLAARPTGAGPSLGPVDRSTPVTSLARPTNWRGLFGWYTATLDVYNTPSMSARATPAARRITNGELYRERTFADATERRSLVRLLDLYFDPTQRGPYNYNGELATAFASRPQDVWGGMVHPIEGNFSDFGGQNNVEFVEMLISPLGGRDGTEPIAPGARLYLDLGRTNEDLIPDAALNTEDGIPERDPTREELSVWGRTSGRGLVSTAIDFYRESGRTEDLGLDGLPSRSTLVAPGGQPYALDEQTQFADFLATLPDGPARERALVDPSADDYRPYRDLEFFNNEALFPGGASFQERLAFTYPTFELNATVPYTEIVGISGLSGRTQVADTEDINGDTQATTIDRYHRYEVPLDAAGLAAHPFVQGALTVEDQTFYLLRIPVRTGLRTVAGLDSTDFSQIESVRLWTTGHDRPATLRIASFKLVGSQWLKSDIVGTALDPGATPTATPPRLFIESVNDEESPDVYVAPRAAVRNESRTGFGAAAPLQDKALVFRAEDLAENRSAGLTRTYSSRPFDLTRYTNVRMYVHGDGFARADSVRVFVRLGDDEAENYYEYEQPLYPTDPAQVAGLSRDARADSLWQTNVLQPDGSRRDLNSVNIVLSELNRLKVARDEALAPLALPYERPADPEATPPGTRLRIVGQPSIKRVRTIVLGVRNGAGGTAVPLDTVQVWFNELRVSGYDEASGSSGFVNAALTLADVGTVTARASFTEGSFGELGSGLGERSFDDRSDLSVASTFAAHKLLPERFGWRIPVSYTFSRNGTTPRFDPERGDLRVSDLADALRRAPSTPEAARAADALVARTQTVGATSSFRVEVDKNGSRSPWLRYSVDGLNLSYAATSSEGRSPTSTVIDRDEWSTNASYRVDVPRPRTVRPFWFTSRVPVAGAVLGGLRLNWLPQSFTFSTALRRSIRNLQDRPAPLFRADPDSVLGFRTRLNTQHSLDHTRLLNLQYNPFTFLRLGYDSDVDQDLSAAGQTQRTRVMVYRAARGDTAAFIRSYPLTDAEARDPGSVVRRDLREAFGDGVIPADGPLPPSVEVLAGGGLQTLPFADALGNVFGGRGTRTQRYSQTLTSSLTLSTRRVKWLAWIQPQALSYRAGFSWADANQTTADPAVRLANVDAQSQFQAGLRVVPREFWRLFPFYRRMEGPARRPAAPAATDSTRRSPLAALRSVPRSLFMGLTGIADVSVTYRGSLNSQATGLSGQGYSLLSGLQGDAPPLGFRLGLDRRLPTDIRLADPTLNLLLADRLADSHQLEGRTSIEPLPGLRVGLVAQTQWTRAVLLPLTLEPSGLLVEGSPSATGTSTSTVYGMGGSYASLVARHAERFRRDAEGADGVVTSKVLTRPGLASDFLAEFANGLGRFGPRGLFRIPVPGWDVSYSGLGRWPLFRRVATDVLLRHNYSATSQSSYRTYAQPLVPRAQTLGGRTVLPPPTGTLADEATTLAASQSFQPLLGLQVTWKGNVQTSLNWERSDVYNLPLGSTFQIQEKHVNNLRLEMSWQKTGFRLFGLRRLNNNLSFNLSASIADDLYYLRPLDSDVRATLSGNPLEDEKPQRTRRYQATPRLGYTLSNRVTASLFLNYTRSEPIGSINLRSTNVDGGVNLRILFSN